MPYGVRHLKLAQSAGVPSIPKHNQFVHLLQNMRRFGNPKMYSSFIDESLNKNLAAVARNAHSFVWERRIFQMWDGLIEMAKKRQRPR